MNNSADKTLLLNQFLPYRLVNIAKRISDECGAIYHQQFGLTIPEWRILARLGEESGLHAKELAVKTFMEKTKVSRAVKSLEDKGLLSKQKDSNDSRIIYLSLNEEGIKLYRQVAPVVLDWEAELLQSLDAPEYRDLFRIMERLESKLDKMVQVEESP